MSANRRVGVELFIKATGKEEIDSTKQKIESIGPTGEASGNQASRAMNGVSSSSRAAAAATGDLLVRKERLSRQVSSLDRAIKSESTSLDLMQRVSARSADAQQLLSGKILESEKTLGALLVQRRAAVEQGKSLDKQLDNTGGAFSRVTNQIRTSGTFLEGWDAAATAAATAAGGLSVGTVVLFGLLSSLAPKIFEIVTAKRELVEIDEAAIKVAALRLEQLRLEGSGIIDASRAFDLAAATKRASGEVDARLVGVAVQLAEANKQLKFEQDALAGSVEAYRGVQDRNANNLEKVKGTLDRVTKIINDQADEVDEASATFNTHIEALRNYQRATGLSTEELLKHLEQQIRTPAIMAQVRNALENAGAGYDSLAARIRAATAEQIKFNIAAIGGSPGAVGRLARGRAELEAFGISDPRRQAAALDAEISATLNIMKREAAALGQTDAERRRIFQQSLADLREYKPEIADLIARNQAAEKGMKAFAESTGKASKGISELQRKIERINEALRQHNKEIARLSIDLIADERERRLALIDFQVEAHREALIKQGVDRKRADQAYIELGRVLIQGFLQWETSERKKYLKKQREERVEQTNAALKAEREALILHGRIVREILTGQDKDQREARLGRDSRQDLQEQIAGLNQRFGGFFANITGEQVNRAAADLKRLGLTIEQVDALFGSASTSLDQFALRLDIITGRNQSAIDSFLQLIDVQQVFLDVLGVIESAIAGAVSGTDNLGKALLAGFLRVIAGIASTLGSLFLLAAAGFIALPGFQWTGAQLFAAGAALIVFAGVLGGLAQRITARNADQAFGATSGPAAAASGGSSRRASRPPVVIDISPRSQRANQPIIVNLRFDRETGRDLLKGEEVLTTKNIKAEHFDRVKGAVRRMA